MSAIVGCHDCKLEVLPRQEVAASSTQSAPGNFCIVLTTELTAAAGSKFSGAVVKQLPRRDSIAAIEVDAALEQAFLQQRNTAREV